MWVKICGITSLDDALTAVEAGADALGFVFVSSSPRAVTRDQVAAILAALPATVLTVGVVANEHPDFLRELLRVCPLRAIQFHGEEPPEEVLAFKGKVKLIKAIRVKDATSLQQIPQYRGVDAILLDAHTAYVKGARSKTWHPRQTVSPGTVFGGTGVAFDWQLANQAKGFGIPLVVAGGLQPTHVADLVRQVHPFGVDVSSGVELSPGRKDRTLVREFILQAKSVGRTKSVGSA